MSTFRHATNLKVPLDPTDLGFLSVLSDYRIGEPLKGRAKTAWEVEELKAKGYVGLYTTEDALNSALVKKRTGWRNPEKILGEEWKA